MHRHREVVPNPLIPANPAGLDLRGVGAAEAGGSQIGGDLAAELGPIVAQERRQAVAVDAPAVHVGEHAVKRPAARGGVATLGIRHRLEHPVEADSRPEKAADRCRQRKALREVVGPGRRGEMAEPRYQTDPINEAAVDRLGVDNLKRDPQPPSHGRSCPHLEIVVLAEDDAARRDPFVGQRGCHEPRIETA